jgi:predicted anti-sigma-YlaC factor YlaD
MALHPRPAICERARTWASLRLDDELSEFEDALLTSHLRRCASCREYEESLRGVALALRSRPPEQLEHPVYVPSSRRRLAARPTALARIAAVAAAAIGLVTVFSVQSGDRFQRTPTPRIAPSDNRDLALARALRAVQLGQMPHTGTLGIRGAVLQRSRL